MMICSSQFPDLPVRKVSCQQRISGQYLHPIYCPWSFIPFCIPFCIPFFGLSFSIILSATDSRSVPSPNIVSLIFLYSIYVSFLSFFFYNFVSNGLQVSASTTQYCLLDRILPLLCLFLHRARNGLPLKLFCRSRNYHKNCFEEKCQAQTLELLRESGNMTAVTVFLCIFPMLSEDVWG